MKRVTSIAAGITLVLALAAAGSAPAASYQHLAILQGSWFIANDPVGINETFGRYQTYQVIVPGSGFRGQLQWRGMGPFREYDVIRAGQRDGSIEHFGSRFLLYDRQHRQVGEISGAWGFNGRYDLRDRSGAVVGYLNSPFGDGQSFNVLGDARTVALLASIGLDLGPVPSARETVRAQRFAALHGR